MLRSRAGKVLGNGTPGFTVRTHGICRNPEIKRRRTDSTGKHLLVVDVALNPSHEVFDVFGCRHFGGFFEVLIILPKIFESDPDLAHGRANTVIPLTHPWPSSPGSSAASRTL
jgi:hypothetical protein